MNSKTIPAVAMIAVSLAVSGSMARADQDTGPAKYNVRVPNGLAFSEGRGYEAWQTVVWSEKLAAANPVTSKFVIRDARTQRRRTVGRGS